MGKLGESASDKMELQGQLTAALWGVLSQRGSLRARLPAPARRCLRVIRGLEGSHNTADEMTERQSWPSILSQGENSAPSFLKQEAATGQLLTELV